MASCSKTTILVTGANRGIGKGLVETLLARPDHVVIAAVRTPSSAEPLAQLPVAYSSRLVVAKIDATAAKKLVGGDQPIDYLDVVIANAGVCNIWPKVADLQIKDMLDCLRPNVFGLA
ncbi:hypothetical protein PG989_016374 [Apiospora arundinis]